MTYYKFLFENDYHCKEDGSHEVKLIQRDLKGIEVALCITESDEIPSYAETMQEEEINFLKSVLENR